MGGREQPLLLLHSLSIEKSILSGWHSESLNGSINASWGHVGALSFKEGLLKTSCGSGAGVSVVTPYLSSYSRRFEQMSTPWKRVWQIERYQYGGSYFSYSSAVCRRCFTFWGLKLKDPEVRRKEVSTKRRGAELLDHTGEGLSRGTRGRDAQAIYKALYSYCKATGMEVNHQKSCIIFHRAVEGKERAIQIESPRYHNIFFQDIIQYIGFLLKPNEYGGLAMALPQDLE